MAALMTSVIDNTGKVSEYILSCRQMGIEILPPDINKGEGDFSVEGKAIRYALTAVQTSDRCAGCFYPPEGSSDKSGGV